MASIRQRGRKWYVEIRRKGVRRNGTFRTKTQAKQWAREIEDAIDDGLAVDANTLHDALSRYDAEVSAQKRGGRWESVRLCRFKRELPDIALDKLRATDIADWRDGRLRQVSTSSVRREMVLLASVLNMARREWGWIAASPMQDVRKPPDRPSREQLISDAQARSIFETAGYTRGMRCYSSRHLAASALDLALETAMRQGEIVGLRGDRINLESRVATLPETKNGTTRHVPLSKGAVAILRGLDSDRPFPISAASLSVTFRKIVAEAGLAGQFTFHDSRASAITRLAHRLEIYDLARVTGHKDLRQLQKYYRATAADIARRLD